MIKKWIIRCGFLLTALIFLSTDLLNQKICKDHIKSLLAPYGIEIEEIEKITLQGASLKGVRWNNLTVEHLSCSYDTIHLIANGIKHFFHRSDFQQEVTIESLSMSYLDIPISLKTPFKAVLKPEGSTHDEIALLVGQGLVLIHSGENSFLAPSIDFYQVDLPPLKGKVSGSIEIGKQKFNLQYVSTNSTQPIEVTTKGSWNEHRVASFGGAGSFGELKKLPFKGKFFLSTTWENFSSSAFEIQGKWNGALKTALAAIEKEFKPLQGDVSVEWQLKGLLTSPSFSAQARLSNGSFEVPGIGLFLKDLKATIEGSDTHWIVKNLSAHDTEKSKGIVEGSGWIDLSTSGLEYCLTMNLKKTAVLMMENLTGIASGNLQLKGNEKEGKLVGKGHVHELKLVIDGDTGIGKDPLDIVFKDEPPPLPPSPPYLFFDLDLNMEKHAIISGQNLKTKWTGEAHLGGTVNDLRLKGDLKLVEGEYRLNGRGIDIKEGLIRFDGNIFKETTVFAIASLELKELIAEMIVRGHLDTLSLTLRSNPPLPQKEILSWILFNQGAKHITSLQGEQLARKLSEFTKGGGGSNPFSEIQGKLGIDTIDLDRRSFGGDEEVSLKLGKYLSKNLFIGVSKGINADINRIGFEASLNRHWKIQGEIGDNAEGQMHLKWKNDY